MRSPGDAYAFLVYLLVNIIILFGWLCASSPRCGCIKDWPLERTRGQCPQSNTRCVIVMHNKDSWAVCRCTPLMQSSAGRRALYLLTYIRGRRIPDRSLTTLFSFSHNAPPEMRHRHSPPLRLHASSHRQTPQYPLQTYLRSPYRAVSRACTFGFLSACLAILMDADRSDMHRSRRTRSARSSS